MQLYANTLTHYYTQRFTKSTLLCNMDFLNDYCLNISDQSITLWLHVTTQIKGLTKSS